VPHELKARIVHQVRDIMFGACVKVVDTQNFVTLADQTFAQVRTEESSSPRYHDPLVDAVALHVVSSVSCAANI
jgi:hypothetical protein